MVHVKLELNGIRSKPSAQNRVDQNRARLKTAQTAPIITVQVILQKYVQAGNGFPVD